MCVWAMTSASRWAVPLPPLWVDEDDVVDVVEPWMAWLIQCSMLMLPWLEVGVPCESPCTEPSSSEPEEVSMGQSRDAVWPSQETHADPAPKHRPAALLRVIPKATPVFHPEHLQLLSEGFLTLQSQTETFQFSPLNSLGRNQRYSLHKHTKQAATGSIFSDMLDLHGLQSETVCSLCSVPRGLSEL